MQLPTLDELREARRGLAVLAAVLFVAAIAFPMWHIHIKAVQYPDQVLHLSLYAYPRITGDFVEVHRLNKYIGFYYPDPVYLSPNYEVQEYAIDVPEWSFGAFAFVGAALLSVFVAVAPTTKKLKRGLTYQLVGTAAVFTAMVADIQYRLYQAGHHLDPDAPVMGVDPFTPPMVGRYEVANITSYSHFGVGAFMAMAAVGLLAVAYYYRDTEVPVRAVPGRAVRRGRGLVDRLRERIQDDEMPAAVQDDETTAGEGR
jgi:hypothetical protein